jgi:crossover junction endodeoxyribonuclease RuvC
VSLLVVGIDPGLAHLGWAAVSLETAGEHLVDVGVVKTEKARAKGSLESDDLHRRGQEHARALARVLDTFAPLAVCAESISYPRSSKASSLLGRSWGVLDAELERRGIALLSASPQAIKLAVCGCRSASKREMIEALDLRFGGRLIDLLGRGRGDGGVPARTKWEHPADAAGAVVACLDRDHLRLARAVAGRGR